MALSVIWHNPKDIEINCFVDKIEVKAKKETDSDSPFDQLTANINETITLGKDLDGTPYVDVVKNEFAELYVTTIKELGENNLTFCTSKTILEETLETLKWNKNIRILRN
jgi:hypothetical protein